MNVFKDDKKCNWLFRYFLSNTQQILQICMISQPFPHGPNKCSLIKGPWPRFGEKTCAMIIAIYYVVAPSINDDSLSN
jgi:hypothetical protein